MPERKITHFDDNRNAIFNGATRPPALSNGNKKRKREGAVSKEHRPDDKGSTSSASRETPFTPAIPSSAAERRNYILAPPFSKPRPESPDPRHSKKSDNTSSWNRPKPKEERLQNSGNHVQSPKDLEARSQALWPKRRALPVWSHSQSIRRALREKDILVLVGETGSGKSTQVPQMLTSEPWFKDSLKRDKRGSRIGGCIAVTEPRRVAAITLAQRVAQEAGTMLGGQKGKVGYSVRFDSSAGPETKIKYLTEGMLLQEMLQDPWLRKYSAVVVDEVHERGTNVDLVLGFLRRMVVDKEGLKERKGHPLKVCVMSATAEVEGLVEFFGEAKAAAMANGVHKDSANGEDIASKHEAEDEESEWEGIQSSGDERKKHAKKASPPKPMANSEKTLVNGNAATSKQETIQNGNVRGNGAPSVLKPSTSTASPSVPPNLEVCYIEGRQHPVSVQYAPDAVPDLMDGYLRAIFQIHLHEEMPGDVLVFLTGQEVVESLEQLVNDYATSLPKDVPQMVVLPLFAALPQTAQQRVFEPVPRGSRKVILATNIAETSVTISGVRYVIDSGKAKVKHFRTRIGLESLLVKPISKSSAIQRKGRAGREAAGKCFRLYTEDFYLGLEQNNTPELLRSDLSQAILVLKARGIPDVYSFPFLSPPPRESLVKALIMLYQLGALSPSGSITKIGKRMANLPLSAPLSRTLLAASDPTFDCLDEAIDIVSCLSVENIFLSTTSLSDEKRDAANAARTDILRREGDHLTLLSVVHAFMAEQTDRKSWCEARLISHRALRAVMDTRKQLRVHFELPTQSSDAATSTIVSTELANWILKAFLTGFKMNTARLMPDGSYRTLAAGNQLVAIHPSSVLMGRKVECIMYNEFVYTQKTYARGVSAVQMDWIGELFDPGSGDGQQERIEGGRGDMNGDLKEDFNEPDDVLENNSR